MVFLNNILGQAGMAGLTGSYNNPAIQQYGPGAHRLANAYTQAQYQNMLGAMAQQRTEWMINGVTMTFDQFVETLCPDPEDPMRSYLILKYKR